jgi:hypothetical protein
MPPASWDSLPPELVAKILEMRAEAMREDAKQRRMQDASDHRLLLGARVARQAPRLPAPSAARREPWHWGILGLHIAF